MEEMRAGVQLEEGSTREMRFATVWPKHQHSALFVPSKQNSRGKVMAKNLSDASGKPSWRNTKLCTSFLADPTLTSWTRFHPSAESVSNRARMSLIDL